MTQAPYISNFKTKLEAISGSAFTEQEAVESFHNLAGFIQTLIEIDKTHQSQPYQQNKSNENANIRSSNISN